jgi:hypothetical protein
MPAVERLGIQGGMYAKDFSTTYMPPGAVSFKYTEESLIQDCTFRNMGENAIVFEKGSHYNMVYNNLFDDIGASGIVVDRRASFTPMGHPMYYEYPNESDHPEGNEISNNTFQNTGVTDLGSNGLFSNFAQGTYIHHNKITNTPYSGLSVGGIGQKSHYSMNKSHHSRAEWNLVYNCMTRMTDGGGVYFFGNQMGLQINNNYVYDIGKEYTDVAHGIYPDNLTNFTQVSYNHVSDVNGVVYGDHIGGNMWGTDNHFHHNCGTSGDNVPYYADPMRFNNFIQGLTDSTPSDEGLYGPQ